MVSRELKNIILSELSLDDWQIDDDTTADMIPGWDSLSHIRIITAVEDAYRVRFRATEIMRLRNVADLQALVDQKLG